LRDPRSGEGVGLDDVRAGVEIGAVNAFDDVRACEYEDVVVAAQVARVIAEGIAPVVRLGEGVSLKHGAPRTVEDEDSLGEQTLEPLLHARRGQSPVILT
jgi:hypothetical protein